MSLISKEGLENYNIANSKKYNGKITNSVKKILKDSFNIDTDSESPNFDESSNAYSFVGANNTPFDLMIKISIKVNCQIKEIPDSSFIKQERD